MDFPIAEFERRTARAQHLMQQQGFDALFLMTEPEVRYFTGFRTLFWQSPTRPWFVIVPSSGKPIAIIPQIGADLMGNTWLDDVRTWSAPDDEDDGISLLVDCLKKSARIGMKMGRESSLRMPLLDFETLRERCKSSHFVDATTLINELRFVKSELEIAAIERICSIACDAFDEVPNMFRVGQSQFEIFSLFKQSLLRNSAEDVPYLVGGAGPLGYEDVISPPSGDACKAGDVLMLDTGATLGGYFCDFDRNFSFGEPIDAVKNTQDMLWLATEAGLAAARPGATCAEIFNAMAKVIGDDESNVGRSGHGLGLELTEAPSLIGWDQTVLREGAVITLEPSMAVEGGRGMLVHEENIVIRDGAPQLLTRRAPREMVML